MQNRRISANIAQPNLRVHRVYGVGGNAARCISNCSLLPRIINARLTMLTAWLTPLPGLRNNKYYVSQDSIDFRIVLSLSCLRVFRCRLFLFALCLLLVHIIPTANLFNSLLIRGFPEAVHNSLYQSTEGV